jgi:Acyl-CoA dehydrogenase, N-terminal domain
MSTEQQNLAERGMAVGLRAEPARLLRLRRSVRTPRAGRALALHGFQDVDADGRDGRPQLRRGPEACLPGPPADGQAELALDLTPSDEQQLLTESVRDFALAKLRPAAPAADADCAVAPELLAQVTELGLTIVGVPEELGASSINARP